MKHSGPSWSTTLKRAAVVTYRAGCVGIAKGAAYSALLAFFPVLTTIAVLLVRFRARAVSQVMARFLESMVPPGSEDLVLNLFTVRGQRPSAVLIGAVFVSIYAASGIMLSLIKGFDAVYRVPNRPFLRQRAVAAALVVLAVVPAVAASALILMGGRTERAVLAWMQGVSSATLTRGGVLLLGQGARIVITMAASVLSAAMLYRIAPNRPMRWRDVWDGAFVVTLAWYAATYCFRFYVANIAAYNVMYGTVAAVIALGVWLYLLGLIALYGCAVNAVRHGRF